MIKRVILFQDRFYERPVELASALHYTLKEHFGLSHEKIRKRVSTAMFKLTKYKVKEPSQQLEVFITKTGSVRTRKVKEGSELDSALRMMSRVTGDIKISPDGRSIVVKGNWDIGAFEDDIEAGKL